ncbi:MAG: PorP/SprF family type IX secretion system membrane protein [Bacteroidales bacterium]|nr:PorP/SprF family type IX secretion system membrane protein [Bacteroidales bacterium]
MKIFLFTLFILSFYLLSAQDISVYNNYFSIPEIHNSAYIGALPCTKISLSQKKQWLGIKGSPSQQILSANILHQTNKFRKSGFGGILFNDLNGDFRTTNLRFIYAQHFMIKKSKGQWLSLALALDMANKGVTKNFTNINNQNDPILNSITQNKFLFDANFGLLYYSNKFSLGTAFYQLFSHKSIADFSYKTTFLGLIHASYTLR